MTAGTRLSAGKIHPLGSVYPARHQRASVPLTVRNGHDRIGMVGLRGRIAAPGFSHHTGGSWPERDHRSCEDGTVLVEPGARESKFQGRLRWNGSQALHAPGVLQSPLY